MTRWEPNPRERLAQAALDLFAERGYDGTTVADIAQRAGLTKSSFFRHFDDKREVLFSGQDDMIAALQDAVSTAPAEASAPDYTSAVLAALAVFFPSEHRARAATRSATIEAHPELRERELLKRANLLSAIETALRSRDVDEIAARLAATITNLALDIAYDRWISHPDERDFARLLSETLHELGTQAVEFARRGAGDPEATGTPGVSLDSRRTP